MKKLFVLFSLIVCLFCFGLNTKVNAEAQDVSMTSSFKLGDLPYQLAHNNYGNYNAGLFDISAQAGWFDANNAENFGLCPFDQSTGDNAVSTQWKAGLNFENWQYVLNNNSIVMIIMPKVNGTVSTDFSACTNIGGWLDWNSGYIVRKLKAADNSLTNLVWTFHLESDAEATFKNPATYEFTTEVAAGDVIYMEFCSSVDRNFQNLQDALVKVTTTEYSEVVKNTYNGKADAKLATLTESSYDAEDWTTITGKVSTFKAATYTTLNELDAAFNTLVSEIDAIVPDPLKSAKNEALTQVNNLFNSLVEENYKAEDWSKIVEAKNTFVNSLETTTEVEALTTALNACLAEMNKYTAVKQNLAYLDLPEKVFAANYGWVTGPVFDYTVMAGTASNPVAFDTHTDNVLTLSEYQGLKLENWRWFIEMDMGIVVMYKANADMKLTVTDIRIADGKGGNGWTEDCTLKVFIVRESGMKKIKEISAPTTDADFSGDYYLKSGDMLYFEFLTVTADSTRNTESPYATTALGNSTLFNQDAYAEQNNDLSTEVVNAINSKTESLQSYFNGLKEADYSATNWLTLTQYMQEFATKCEEEVKTVEQVNSLYDTTLANMEAVQTLAEAQAELTAYLTTVANALEEEYNKLLKENKYSDENKAELKKILDEGKAAIMASKSKTLGNNNKTSYIAKLSNVETSQATGGCGKGAVVVFICSLLSVLSVCFLRRKSTR